MFDSILVLRATQPLVAAHPGSVCMAPSHGIGLKLDQSWVGHSIPCETGHSKSWYVRSVMCGKKRKCWRKCGICTQWTTT